MLSKDGHSLGLLLRRPVTDFIEPIAHRLEDQRAKRSVRDGEPLQIEAVEPHHAAVARRAYVHERIGSEQHRRFPEETAAVARPENDLARADALGDLHRPGERHIECRFFALAHQIFAGAARAGPQPSL